MLPHLKKYRENRGERERERFGRNVTRDLRNRAMENMTLNILRDGIKDEQIHSRLTDI